MLPHRSRSNETLLHLLAISVLTSGSVDWARAVAWARKSLPTGQHRELALRHRQATNIRSLSATETPERDGASQTCMRILHESDRILVIDKPHGIPHQSSRQSGFERPDAGTSTDSHAPSQGVLALLREQQATGRLNYQGRLYGVHRLDRVTSGILVLAKDQEMSRVLTRAFRSGTVIKYYTGISAVKARKKQGWVKGRMVRGRRKSWYLTRERGDGSNYAVTRFFTSGLGSVNDLDSLNSPTDATASPRTLILFRPYTGRTHQLRVAAKSVGMPLAGDPVYTSNLEHSWERTYLHATALRIPDIELAVVSPPPFERLWDPKASDAFLQSLSNLVERYCEDAVLRDLLREHLSGKQTGRSCL